MEVHERKAKHTGGTDNSPAPMLHARVDNLLPNRTYPNSDDAN